MIRTVSALLVAASLSACMMNPAFAKEQTFNDDEQRGFVALCELGEWANRIQVAGFCSALRLKIGQLPPQGQPQPIPAEKKPEEK